MLVEINMIIFSSLLVIISSLTECPKTQPILYKGNCVFGLLKKKSYETGKCVVANKIVKIQWVTSVIFVDMPYAHVFFQKYQNGDLILEILPHTSSYKRMFYKLKHDEEELLVKDGELTHSFTLESNYYSYYDGNLYLIKIGEDEYPVFFGRKGFGIELYDLKEEKVTFYWNHTILDGNNFAFTGSNIFVTNFTLNNTNLYLLAYNNGLNSRLKICEFNSKDLENGINALKSVNLIGQSISPISCFITVSNIIICSYTINFSPNVSSEDGSIYFQYDIRMTVSAYNENLVELKKKEIYNMSTYNIDRYFFKCLHLKGDAGIFLYMSKMIFVINYNRDNNEFENYFPESNINSISLSYIDESTYYPKNFIEFLKISDSKFCYINFAISGNDPYTQGPYIAIILINFINSQTMIMRYYYIKMTGLFGYYKDESCKFNIYNDYIALSFSTLTVENGNQTAFMLLSYANNTNQNFDILEYLLNNNDIKIYNISKDLKDYLLIENNIFGYKIKRCEIVEKMDCINFDMKLINSDKFIEANTSLTPDDTPFVINFKGNDTYYKGNCSIKLKLYITEPDFGEDKDYYEKIENHYGEFDEESYNQQKKIYGGKESIFNIELPKDLSTRCSNINCELCLVEDRDICIICKSNFTFNEEMKGKICEFNASDTIEESDFVSNTLKMSDSIDDTLKITDSIDDTLKMSDSIDDTLKITDSINDTLKITDSVKDTFELSDTILFSNEVTNNFSRSDEISNTILDTNDINNSSSYINEISDSILDSIKTCNKEELLDENISVNDFLSNNQIEEIFNNLTIYTIKCNNTNESIIIQARNAIFEWSTFEFQKYYDNLNFSSIDLGQCENILRQRNNISNDNSLFILKMDIKNIETKSTYVQYEIYDSFTLKRLKLDYCKNLNLKIILYVPAQLDSTCVSLYENLKKWGYNLFDSGDPFYHDVCTLFTNQFGTDVIIEDRRKDYYLPYNTLQLCQEGCDFNSYDKLIKKAECYCNGQTNVVITDITKLHLDKDIIADSFIDTIKNSNFRVLKCYKVAIDLTTILTNLGRIILTLIFVLFLVLMIIYYVKEKKKINKNISYILKGKLNNIQNIIENKPKSKIIKKKKRKKVQKHSIVFNLDNNEIKKNIDNDNKNKYRITVKKNTNEVSSCNSINDDNRNKRNKILKKQSTDNIFSESLKIEENNLKKKNKNNSGPPKRVKRKIKINSNSSKNINSDSFSNNNNKLIDSKTNVYISSYNEKNKMNNPYSKIKDNYEKNKLIDIDSCKSKIMEKQDKKNKISENDLEDKSIYINMNDQELNTLEYDKALIYDNRSYFQYYWSLLKKKHLILFTFYPQNDYNLITLKISFFLIGFSLYFTINGFFFSDDSMHKVYIDRGIYNFVYQITQILYSSVVSAIINMILKKLSLSEKNIIELKREKDENVFLEKFKSISQYLIRKFLIFFILSFLLLLFFWYFISCFCGVYVNTQIIFIKNTFISFALSMVYPFGLNLLPGFFRIPALRDKKKEHNCLYKISGYIALF